MDMLGSALRAAGIDVDQVVNQIGAIHALFQQIGVRLEGIEARLLQLEQSQIALMTHFGLFVPPSLEVMSVIEAESARHVETVAMIESGGVAAGARESETVRPFRIGGGVS